MLIFLLVGLLLSYILHQRFLHPLAKYPGPFLASFTNLWKAYHVIRGDYEYAILDLHRKHGSFIRIGPNHLDISHAAAVKDIYLTGKTFAKSPFYDAFTALRPNIFGTRDETIHAARKKALTPGFSLQSVTQMEPYIDGCLTKLIARLDRAAADGETIDLKAWFSFFVIDVLGELAFSQSFNMLEKGQTDALPPLREHVFLAMLSGQFPSLIPYINAALPHIPIPAIQHALAGRQKLRQLAITSVAARLAHPDPTRRDLLANLIQEHDRGNLELLDIQTEAFGYLIAGSHTTATTLTLLFHHLLHNPATHSRLADEILHTIPPPPPGGKNESCYPHATTTSAKYLAATLTETLRITPVFTMPLLRVVPPAGGGGPVVVAGHPLPPGTDVSVCNHALHHDPSVFGAELERFAPERWLGGGGAAAQEKAKCLMAFGAGHRACIGRNLAMVEIGKVVVAVVARYRVELAAAAAVPGEGGGEGRMPRMTSFGISDLEAGLGVRLRRRV